MLGTKLMKLAAENWKSQKGRMKNKRKKEFSMKKKN